jgi:hypothetical protein
LSPGRRTNRENFKGAEERLCLYTFYFYSQLKLRDCMWRVLNEVQGVHRGVNWNWCSGLRNRAIPAIFKD